MFTEERASLSFSTEPLPRGCEHGEAFPGPGRQGVMCRTSLPPPGIANSLTSKFQKILLMLFIISMLNKTETSCWL